MSCRQDDYIAIVQRILGVDAPVQSFIPYASDPGVLRQHGLAAMTALIHVRHSLGSHCPTHGVPTRPSGAFSLKACPALQPLQPRSAEPPATQEDASSGSPWALAWRAFSHVATQWTFCSLSKSNSSNRFILFHMLFA